MTFLRKSTEKTCQEVNVWMNMGHIARVYGSSVWNGGSTPLVRPLKRQVLFIQDKGTNFL